MGSVAPYYSWKGKYYNLRGSQILKPIDDISQEYYMTVTYVIPNDSIILKSRNLINQTRANWNLEIVKTIKNYFGVDVIINSSGTQSESYYNRQKRYE